MDARNAIEAPDDARLSAHVVGSGDAEKRKNEIQCAVALGEFCGVLWRAAWHEIDDEGCMMQIG